MQIRSAQEALFIAAEMERRAVQVYQRALMLLEDQGRHGEPICDSLRHTLADEQRHLQQFHTLYLGLGEPMERQLTLAAIANGVLFEGGLMEAVREGFVSDVPGMLGYAAQEEARAAETYHAFARQCRDPETRAVLEAIAVEEERHLSDLLTQKGDTEE